MGASDFEIKARLKNQRKLAMDAPAAKRTLFSPKNCCEIEPIRTIVSRYTWGFAKVNIAVIEMAFLILTGFAFSAVMAKLDLKDDLILKSPYVKSHNDASPKIIPEYLIMKSFKKYEIPTIPRIISNASEIEQNRAI
jgi:hypothetical protein